MLEKTLLRLSDCTTYVDESKPKDLKLGKYTICPDQILGVGSFSAVYLCKDEEGKRAAVKILKKRGKKMDSTIIKVSKAEATIAKKLKHPGIVSYLGSFESDNHYYILFQYCEGKTLREIAKPGRSVPIADVISITTSLISALNYLHEKKIMHRDIKPENIKYSQNKAVLLDLGFACELPHGDKTILHDSVGTPSYMSPEMLQRKNYKSNSDIWSLGVVLYELVYGKLPWSGRNQSELIKAINRDPLVLPSKPRIPESLASLISGCLKKSSERINWVHLLEYSRVNWTSEMESKNEGLFCSFFNLF